ncbi:MAG: FHA domain-containing protein [Candidatus Wenzhouxiangella sp. M2_3B_020]
MKGDSEHTRSKKGRAGPQGTQVFSRDQIDSILQQDEADEDDGQRASLVLLTVPDNQGRHTFALKNDRLTIGRSQVCDICIEEPSMSSEHARMVRSEDAWRIINLLSTNGVFVNDEKVFSHRLHDGDEIRLGRTRLRFNDPSGSSRPATGGSQWVVWVGGLIALAALGALAFWML